MNANIKRFFSASIFTLASSSAFAFQSEVDLIFISSENSDSLGAAYSYHIQDVTLSGKAWSEAAFMSRSTFFTASASRNNPDSEFVSSTNSFSVGGVINFAEDWFVTGALLDVDETTILGAGLGYYYNQNQALFLGYSNNEFEEKFEFGSSNSSTDILTFGIKSIYELQPGQFLDLEAAISRVETEEEDTFFGDSSRESNDFVSAGVSVEYYFTPQTSFGGRYINKSTFFGFGVEEREIGLTFNHYFSEQFGIGIDHTDLDFTDFTAISANFRF